MRLASAWHESGKQKYLSAKRDDSSAWPKDDNGSDQPKASLTTASFESNGWREGLDNHSIFSCSQRYPLLNFKLEKSTTEMNFYSPIDKTNLLIMKRNLFGWRQRKYTWSRSIVSLEKRSKKGVNCRYAAPYYASLQKSSETGSHYSEYSWNEPYKLSERNSCLIWSQRKIRGYFLMAVEEKETFRARQYLEELNIL